MDWLTQLPWGKHSNENFDLEFAKNILDQEHYGMKDVKDRILEFIAVGKLKQSVQGKILCRGYFKYRFVGSTRSWKNIHRKVNRKSIE